MLDIIKIACTFIIIIFLLRKKCKVGYVLIFASLFLAVVYLMRPLSVGMTIYSTMASPITFQLFIALTFIRMFELILREKDVFKHMMEFIKGIVKNKKVVIISMPLLIGMLPSVGGAYFSAPMVDEAAKELNLQAEDKAFTNYWYRHPWELILPVYPGIILASVVTKVNLREFILLNLCSAVTMLITGMIFGMRGVKGAFTFKGKISKKGIWSFAPLAILLILVIGAGIRLDGALVCVVTALLIFFRYNCRSLCKVLKYGFSVDIIILIFGVMLFKETLQSSGAVENLIRFFTLKQIPVFPVLFILPFVSGILTGISVGFVGSVFPLILSLPGGVSAHALSFAFTSGYLGVLLSPVHVCLVLTKEYFNADTLGIYKRTIPSTLFVFLVSIAEYVIFN